MVMLRNMGPLIQQKKCVWLVCLCGLCCVFTYPQTIFPGVTTRLLNSWCRREHIRHMRFFSKKNKINCPDAATQKAVSASTLCRSVKTNFKKVIWLWWKSNLTVELGTTSHSNSPICVTARSRNDIAKFLKCKTWQTRAALDWVSTHLSTVPVCRTR